MTAIYRFKNGVKNKIFNLWLLMGKNLLIFTNKNLIELYAILS